MDGADPLYTLCLAFLLAGVVLGFLLRPLMEARAHRELGIDAEKVDALNREITEHRSLTLEQAAERIARRPLIPAGHADYVTVGPPGLLFVVTSNGNPSCGGKFLRPEDFEQLAGVSAERISNLMAQ